jgi:HEAT repeat protein
MSDTASDADELTTQLKSTDLELRRAAAEILSRMGEDAAPAAVALVRVCSDVDEQVREHAVAALEDLGPPPADAIAQLVALVDHKDPLVGYWATTLLGRAGEDAESAVPALTKCVDSTADLAVRQRAAWALGKIGPAAAAARDALTRAAGQADPRLARLATEALEEIGG